MDTLTNLGDIVGLIGLVTASALLLATPSLSGLDTKASRSFLVLALMVVAFATTSDIADRYGLLRSLDAYEGYVETLFPIFLLMSVYSAYSAQQVGDLRLSQRALSQSHDLMMGILDSAPAGVMFLDSSGRITFANEAAKVVLDLTEDEETGEITSAQWVVRDSAGNETSDLAPVCKRPGLRAEQMTVQWPNGWQVGLRVSTQPLGDSAGRPAGVVMTFEVPAGLRT